MDNMILIAFGSILSILLTILVSQFSSVKGDIAKLVENVGALNVKIAKILTDQDWHKNEIDGLKKELEAVKEKMERS